jgi:hypothetical protein
MTLYIYHKPILNKKNKTNHLSLSLSLLLADNNTPHRLAMSAVYAGYTSEGEYPMGKSSIQSFFKTERNYLYLVFLSCDAMLVKMI